MSSHGVQGVSANRRGDCADGELPLQDSNLDYLIQSGLSQRLSSDNALIHREFASFVVGKKTRKIRPCRTLRIQKRWQCQGESDTDVGGADRDAMRRPTTRNEFGSVRAERASGEFRCCRTPW